jgi:hypothetical protein
MKSALRFLSLALTSAAMMLGPGQAIAGDEWDGGKGFGKDRFGGRGRGHGKSKDSRIRDVDLCVDYYSGEVNVRFKALGGGNPHSRDFDVALEIDGEAVCECIGDKGGKDRSEIVIFDDVCSEEEHAYRERGNKYEATFYFEDLDHLICSRPGDVIVELDLDHVKVLIDDCEYRPDFVGYCDDDRYDDWWH